MLRELDARAVIGATAYSSDGDKIGTVGQLFLDDQTGMPEFVTVNTGLFGTSETFIPIAHATASGDRVTVPFTKDRIKEAPTVGVQDGHIDQAEKRRLYEYYGLGDREIGADGVAPTNSRSAGYDVSGPTTDDAMTRSEEHLDAGTTSQETDRVRLRKYVTTEEETHTPYRSVRRRPSWSGNRSPRQMSMPPLPDRTSQKRNTRSCSTKIA